MVRQADICSDRQTDIWVYIYIFIYDQTDKQTDMMHICRQKYEMGDLKIINVEIYKSQVIFYFALTLTDLQGIYSDKAHLKFDTSAIVQISILFCFTFYISLSVD